MSVAKSSSVSLFALAARAREVWFRYRESLAVCNTCEDEEEEEEEEEEEDSVGVGGEDACALE